MPADTPLVNLPLHTLGIPPAPTPQPAPAKFTMPAGTSLVNLPLHTLGIPNPPKPSGPYIPIDPVPMWDREDVKKYFESKSHLPDKYIASLYDEHVTGIDFPYLTEETLATSYKFPRAVAARFERAITAVLTPPQAVEPKPDHHRQQRWNKLNAILDNNKSKKKRPFPDQENRVSTGYSYSSWADVSPVFDPIRKEYEQTSKPIPDADYEILSVVLSWIIKCYHSTLFDSKDNEAKRIHLIAPVLWSVVQLLPDVRVNVQQNLDGNRVHSHSYFEFILTRGLKRVCIVEAKEEKFKQGLAQSLLGCEVAADLDNSHEVFGVVTNFEKWIFLKSLDDEVLCDEFNVVSFKHGIPVREQLMTVVGKLRSILE